MHCPNCGSLQTLVDHHGPFECEAEGCGWNRSQMATTLKEAERDVIMRALARAGGNRKEAAGILDTSLRNLQYKIKAYGLKTR